MDGYKYVLELMALFFLKTETFIAKNCFFKCVKFDLHFVH